MYRLTGPEPEYFLVHPGGPFWRNKDLGAWSIPKGEPNAQEGLEEAARREFFEETGIRLQGKPVALSPVKLKSGKLVTAFAILFDFDARQIRSNELELEWPPKSGKRIMIPEVDKGEWFTLKLARVKINQGQLPLLAELSDALQHRNDV